MSGPVAPHEPHAEPREPLTLAAVDLGSNSFHMVVARVVGPDMHVIDRVKEPVRIAEELDDKNRLSASAQQRALACVERMGQRLREFAPRHVRVVGTNTLRRAQNLDSFRPALEAALGHPIEIVSGQEEARLVHLGVALDQFSPDLRLVVDIGGGSTEVILGQGFEALRAHSLFMGHVAYSRRFFAEGAVRRESFKRAELAAGLELRSIQAGLRSMGWLTCTGSSGTIESISEILRLNGWGGPQITLGGLKKLRKAVVQAGQARKLRLDGLRSERARVLPGGLAILIALFKGLEIESMAASGGALREGVLFDLMGRIRHEDVRDATIRRLERQYSVDLVQAARVERTAMLLVDQLEEQDALDGEFTRRPLVWASRLHEAGLALSYTGYHKHGAYLVLHSEMPGFSRDDTALLATLIQGHRRKLHRGLFAELPQRRVETARRMCLILRLAVLFNRGRGSATRPQIRVGPDWGSIDLTFHQGWLDDHPLTRADLEQESSYLRAAGLNLALSETEAQLG